MSYEMPTRELGTNDGQRPIVVTDLKFMHDTIWPLVREILHSDDRGLSAVETGESFERLETLSTQLGVAIEALRSALLERNRV